MNEILQSVLDSDYVVFNTKFQDKLEKKYDSDIEEIKTNFKENIFKETLKINDGTKVMKCKECGAILTPGIPIMGSCPKCGALLTDD